MYLTIWRTLIRPNNFNYSLQQRPIATPKAVASYTIFQGRGARASHTPGDTPSTGILFGMLRAAVYYFKLLR